MKVPPMFFTLKKKATEYEKASFAFLLSYQIPNNVNEALKSHSTKFTILGHILRKIQKILIFVILFHKIQLYLIDPLEWKMEYLFGVFDTSVLLVIV